MATNQKTSKRKGNWKKYSSHAPTWKKKFSEDLRGGLKGFIVTCDGIENKAVAEAYNILNQFADKYFGPEDVYKAEKEDDANDGDVEKELEKELEGLKTTEPKKRRFQSIKTGVNHCIFIKSTLDDPCEFVHRMLSEIQQENLKLARFCLKVIPVAKTCYASTDSILDTAKEVLTPVFLTADAKPTTFCIQFKHRCNNVIKRDNLLPEVAQLILDTDNGHSVSFDNPQYVINLDLIKNTCAISLLKDFSSLKKYNIQSIAGYQQESASKEDDASLNENGGTAEKEESAKDKITDTNVVENKPEEKDDSKQEEQLE